MQTLCHLAKLPYEQAKKYGDKTVFEYKDFGGTMWKKASWQDFADNARRVSLAMLRAGVKVQENIGVFSQNSLPYIYTDFGAFGVRAVTIPFYATSSEQQLQYVINDAQIRFFFVGEQEQYDKARRVQALCPTLERIIIYDQSVTLAEHDATSVYFKDFIEEGKEMGDEQLNALLSSLSDNDIANILYTSGTTGESKGVVLTNGQYMAAFKANDKCVPVGEDDRVITFLPITHIFERGWDFLALTEGATIIINTDPHEIQKSMRETHPTCMSAVPRFWEKVYAGVQEKIDNASGMQKKMFMEEVEHEIKARIIEGVTISNEEIRSPEGMTDRLIVKMENSNISMAFRLQEIYEDYDGRLEVQVEGLVDTIQENMNVREKEADVKSFIMDFDKAKDHLHLRLIPGDSPALSDTPHVMIEDMALVANLDIVGFAEDGRTCAIICDALLAHYGISKDELFEIARDNSVAMEPLRFESLEHKVASLLQEEDIDVPVDMNNTAYIATNTSGFNGASVIARWRFRRVNSVPCAKPVSTRR